MAQKLFHYLTQFTHCSTLILLRKRAEIILKELFISASVINSTWVNNCYLIYDLLNTCETPWNSYACSKVFILSKTQQTATQITSIHVS
jgi:hypothetical protein